MKRWTKTLSLVLAVLMLCTVLSGGFRAKAAGGAVQMGDVVQLGDFEKGSLHIVFYPKAMETSDQRWPLIIWANGTMCAPVLYTQFLKDLAAEGFVVVTSSNVMSADGKDQIKSLNWILQQNETEDSVFFGKIDGTRAAAMGHSQGGRSTVNAAAADSRFVCAISIAGSNFTSEAKKLSAPTLFFTGTADLFVLSSLWVKPAYKNCTGPAVYTSLKNGIHITCMLKPDVYVNYCAQWLRAWMDQDAGALAVFRQGGALSNDGIWKDYASKNLGF